MQGFLVVSFLVVLPPKPSMHSLHPHACYMACTSHSPWLDHFNYAWRKVKLPSCPFFNAVSCTTVRLRCERVKTKKKTRNLFAGASTPGFSFNIEMRGFCPFTSLPVRVNGLPVCLSACTGCYVPTFNTSSYIPTSPHSSLLRILSVRLTNVTPFIK
jgi:hypothetical protein